MTAPDPRTVITELLAPIVGVAGANECADVLAADPRIAIVSGVAAMTVYKSMMADLISAQKSTQNAVGMGHDPAMATAHLGHAVSIIGGVLEKLLAELDRAAGGES